MKTSRLVKAEYIERDTYGGGIFKGGEAFVGSVYGLTYQDIVDQLGNPMKKGLGSQDDLTFAWDAILYNFQQFTDVKDQFPGVRQVKFTLLWEDCGQSSSESRALRKEVEENPYSTLDVVKVFGSSEKAGAIAETIRHAFPSASVSF